MSKYTPGPWKMRYRTWGTNLYGGGPLGDDVEVGTDYFVVVRVSRGMEGVTDTDVANARLIASAPELLEACEKLLEWIDNLEAQGYKDELLNTLPNNFGRSIARDVIAKATFDTDAIERAQDDYAKVEAERELIGFEEEQ
jgi:hypothetical protein